MQNYPLTSVAIWLKLQLPNDQRLGAQKEIYT